jgi:DNA invertase Pin-like site-specific DNA recombinase
MGNIAAYIRASTEKQVDDHQRDAIVRWCEENGEEIAAGGWYVDVGSGAKDDREQFQQLLGDVEAGEVDRVVVWEISRISRSGATLQNFFDLCAETETTVVITDGAIEEVKPDGTGRFVADIIGMVYAEERRTLIRRIEAGVSRAQGEGKWLGQVPAGFYRDGDGYLQPNLNPDHDSGEVGFLELREALRRIEDGESYRSVAKSLPITRQTLANINDDEERRAWYVDGEAEDERVDDALGLVQHRTKEPW